MLRILIALFGFINIQCHSSVVRDFPEQFSSTFFFLRHCQKVFCENIFSMSPSLHVKNEAKENESR